MGKRTPSVPRIVWIGVPAAAAAVLAALALPFIAMSESGESQAELQSELQPFVLVSDDRDLELKRSISYTDIEDQAEASARVYAGPADVTARFVLISSSSSATTSTDGDPTFVAHPAGPTGATARSPLEGTQAVSITVSRASDAEHAVQIAADLAAKIRGGAELGFEEGGKPAASIGDFELIASINKGESTGRRDQVVQIYERSAGGELTVRQDALSDEARPFDLAVMALDTPIEFDGGYQFVWHPGGNGVVSSLIAKRDDDQVTIDGAGTKENALRVLKSLKPMEWSQYIQKLNDTFEAAIASLSPKPLSDDFVVYSDAMNPSIVCPASSQPTQDSCGLALSESPMIAAIPAKRGHTVIYCSSQQQVETVKFNGAEVDTSKQACGVFATSLVTKPQLTIDTVVDGFASTATFELASGS